MKQATEIDKSDSVEEQASSWIVKLNAGKLSRDDAFAFEDWLNESNAHRQAFKRLSAVWKDAGAILEPHQTKTQEDFALSRIFLAWTRVNPVRASIGIAVVSLMLVIGAVSISFPFIASRQPDIGHVVLATQIGESRAYTLPDGSRVQLNTDTGIETDFTDEARVVWLSRGEAHFDVAKNPGRPFRVYTGQGVVEAVGTSFNVRVKANATEVTVTEGRVRLAKVSNELDLEGGALLPKPQDTLAMVDGGRGAVFNQKLISVEEIPQEKIEKRLSWQKGKLLFDGDTLELAVQEFERYTSTKIVILDQEIRNTRVVGYFNAGDTDKFLHALDQSFGIASRPAGEDKVLLYRKEG